MVKITVLLVTKKIEPKFEYVLQSLKDQKLEKLKYSDFELLIVDGYYDIRKDKVLKLIDDIVGDKFPVLYIRDKPSRWRGQRPAVSSARNTGLIFANKDSKYIVQVDDCIKMNNDWLEKHLVWLEKGYLVAGSWIGYEGNYDPEYRSTIVKEPEEVGAGWFYGQNCSYSLEAALDVNGFDEILDGELGQEDISFAIRLERKGFKIIFDPTNKTGVYMSTHGYENMIPPVNLKLKNGTLHFSNEWITERLLDDTERILPYGNIIDIRTMRNVMRECKLGIDDMYELMESWIYPGPKDWRDGKLIEDKLKSNK